MVVVAVAVVISLSATAVTSQESRGLPEGAASLAFVFDITGSMYDDLVQVIEGAAKILATALFRRDKPLYNYVLVPFHDPGECLTHTPLYPPVPVDFCLSRLYLSHFLSIPLITPALFVSFPFLYLCLSVSCSLYLCLLLYNFFLSLFLSLFFFFVAVCWARQVADRVLLFLFLLLLWLV